MQLERLDDFAKVFRFKNLSKTLPRGWDAITLCDSGPTSGLLARCVRSKTLSIWQGDRMASVDRVKAERELDTEHGRLAQTDGIAVGWGF